MPRKIIATQVFGRQGDPGKKGDIGDVTPAALAAKDAAEGAASSAVQVLTDTEGVRAQTVAEREAAELAASAAEAHKAAVEAVQATNDGIMTSVARDKESEFARELTGEIVAGIDAAPVARTAAPASAQFAPPLGFAHVDTIKGYAFLNFEPGSGNMIAAVLGSAAGSSIARSTDSGKTWTTIGVVDPANSPGHLWYTAAGAWLCSSNGGRLYRSTDAGATWAQVSGLDPGVGILQEGLTQDAGGTLYAARYGGGGNKVYASTDDGVTWTVHSTFATSDAGDPQPTIRHIHGIKSLPSGLWLYTGDNHLQCGFWRWESGAWVRKSPAVPDPDAQIWRAVGLTERNGWLYWIQDGAGGAPARKPAIFKAHPSDLAGTVIEVAGDLPIGGWYTAHMADGTILIGGVVEVNFGDEEDRAVRLWAVTPDDKVHELYAAERVPDAVVDFTALRNLHVRASDGLVAFTVNQVDFTGPGASSYASVFGHVRQGGARFVPSPQATPQAFSGTPRTLHRSVITTSSPVYAGLTEALMPEMRVKVLSRMRPMLVLIKATVSMSAANVEGRFTLYRNGSVVPGNTWTIKPTTTDYFPMVWWAIVDPLNLVDQTFELHWRSTSNGVQVRSLFSDRSLTVLEL
ncbi:hypothetical protein J2S59_000174 [Nocardioides massiliensis]|uniref:Exo-alpha-sialidase n=2 Tax=Nocardioides massiliensis TaxID=1325935 RepID=A0ABT9NJX0_9ACTN|nr:sialidase family protein [Nocardioides massiliensis]MDP9820365.1 hypothetical protein [Nocardioides massiliensis]